jgi:hypothetical protein
VTRPGPQQARWFDLQTTVGLTPRQRWRRQFVAT